MIIDFMQASHHPSNRVHGVIAPEVGKTYSVV